MQVLYPASSDHIPLKIARHSPCILCDTCYGLNPPPDLEVVLDDTSPMGSSLGDLDQYGSDEDEDQRPYLETCSCGHGVAEHGADENVLGPQEFARIGRVAIRLDELLQDKYKLLDFSYTDEDIESLKRQIKPLASSTGSTPGASATPSSRASSVLSDPPVQPPTKKRRLSSSGIYTDSDDSEDDGQPLASQVSPPKPSPDKASKPAPGGKRTGKKAPGQKMKASMVPTSLPHPTAHQQAMMNNVTNGSPTKPHETRLRMEDKLDQKQLDRLATGVTVDTGGQTSAAPPVKTEKASVVELRKGIIRIVPVENDREPRSYVILNGLKALFQKQLPKMPREYITRLVFDSNSKALAIIKRGYKVVGGICFRPFPHRGFAEIVFFATNSADQVKGYGAMLMDHFKTHIRKTYPAMHHFLTYADNYAVGYFEKQGFSKEITLNRSVWAGYIKDYEGGTIMQCTMLEKVDYLDKPRIIAQQKEAILSKIREMSRSHVVYEGLKFQSGADGETLPLDPKDVPGLRETGWTHAMSQRAAPRNAEQTIMERLLSELKNHSVAWAFLNPVSETEVPDYYTVIKNPMDFLTMEHKLDNKKYRSLDEFVADAQLVFDNCRLYNSEGSVYHKSATKIEKFLRSQLAALDRR